MPHFPPHKKSNRGKIHFAANEHNHNSNLFTFVAWCAYGPIQRMLQLRRFRFWAVLLLSLASTAAGKSGYDPSQYVGVVAIAQQGNTAVCTVQQAADIEAVLVKVADDAQRNYRRRGLMAQQEPSEHQAERNLQAATCSRDCAGFPCGQCYVAYPKCVGYYPCSKRRDLAHDQNEEATLAQEQSPQDQTMIVTTTTQNLRRDLEQQKQRALLLPEVNTRGWYTEHFKSTDTDAHAYCGYLRPLVETAIADMNNRVPNLGSACGNMYTRKFLVGCIYM